MFGSYFTNHKVISSNSNGSLFVSRRQSNTKNEIPNTKEDTSRYYNDSKQRNTSRKNSQEVRSSYNSLTISQQQINQQQQPTQGMQTAIMNIQQNDDKHELLRNSFSNQKSLSNSSKQLNNENGFNSPATNGGSSSLFFQKTNFESKILQKKMNEGQLLSMQNQKTFTVGNYNAGTASQLNINKFKIMLEQNNSIRTIPSHQNLFRNDTDRYVTENRETLDSFQGNGGDQQIGEKENNKYFFSQFTKKNKQISEGIQQNFTQNNNYQPNDVEDFTIQINQKNSAKKFTNQITTTASQQTLDSANNLDHLVSLHQQHNQSKPKNLQELLKSETEKDNNLNNKSIGSSDLNQKHMSSQQLNDFFNQKKSLSPRKVIKETGTIQSPIYRQQNSERKAVLNSPDIQNSKSLENVFSQNQSMQKIKSFHQNLQQFTAQQNKSKQNCNGNGSLQSSFQVKNELAQSTNMDEKQVSHYFTKDQETVLNSGKKQHSQHNSNNLAGSIVNLKKSKKKTEGQQMINNLHSSQEPEISLLKMENINLKNQNQVLTMKNETLEKEKKHYKNICNKKQLEIEQLNEQITSLRSQVDQMKIQIKLSTHSQESTLSQKHQTQVLQSAHNMSSQDTPRQMNQNSNNNNVNYSSSPHFQQAMQNFTQQQQNYALANGQQYNNNINCQYKLNHLSNQIQQNCVQNQQQQVQQQIDVQSQQQIFSQLQLQHQAKQLQQQNVQNTIQTLNQLQFSQTNNYSPQKSSSCLQTNKNNGLSPIVNSEERSDFVSNSILEDIPTAQSHIRTINSSLVIQNLNLNDDFEVIQNEYLANNNFQMSNLYSNTLPLPSQTNSKF
ncbi:endo-1,4-beta-xylanase xylA, putative (macronuclear) [Tetrahymena thermophila SB210]|uniref:Endo-1,4-beta-xylanase xylA, putative n=1 Tax=Tetrahymena thermophila (strain SB210) TaxID=312017 RepID=Q24D53_TETTS|nr:endo-1,4-beta-xylanase xylA, putative [Tetrahymena thermophila SB210]EAS05688.2 endo-1,4-beta-xylanase xylA, putative [Tetrahymena thermophila SB210]|eukprot:XP_001025933.2 endo-1,4-beta-xylanase xylA, putative [Tetrahymena thermophila SB210]